MRTKIKFKKSKTNHEKEREREREREITEDKRNRTHTKTREQEDVNSSTEHGSVGSVHFLSQRPLNAPSTATNGYWKTRTPMRTLIEVGGHSWHGAPLLSSLFSLSSYFYAFFAFVVIHICIVLFTLLLFPPPS